MILIALTLAAAAPTAEAMELGRQLAEAGTLAALLPALKEEDVEQILTDHSGLSDQDKATLRRIADNVFESGRDRLMEATGRAYAERLTVEELRQLVAFQKTAEAQRYRVVTPEVIAATLEAVGPLDYKADVLAAFCELTEKLCEAE